MRYLWAVLIGITFLSLMQDGIADAQATVIAAPVLETSDDHEAEAVDTKRDECVPRCTDRWQNGSCRRWGADFCSPYAVCAPRCVDRWLDGDCRSWGADFCAPFAECSAHCVQRWMDGRCRRWGPDVCF